MSSEECPGQFMVCRLQIQELSNMISSIPLTALSENGEAPFARKIIS